MARKKDQKEPSKPVNYTLYNQKITFEFLKAHLWSAADILRGSLDPSEYRQPVMTLLFIKRLNDTFEENAEKLIKEGKSQKEAYDNKNSLRLFLDSKGSKADTQIENLDLLLDESTIMMLPNSKGPKPKISQQKKTATNTRFNK